MNQDLVCVFDIESGVYKGDITKIHFRPDKLRKLEKIVDSYLKDYNMEYVIRDKMKITIPRYVSIGLMPFETFQRGCYEDPELAFLYKMDRYTFLLSEDGIDQFLDFWKDLLDHITNRGNILLLAHNANYDTNGILYASKSNDGNRLVNITRAWMEEHHGVYTAFPESEHDDKTFDLLCKDSKHHIRLIDTLNLSPIGCKSLRKWGERASAMYSKKYGKLDTYDYDYPIYSIEDIPPKDKEIVYTDRDLQLCLYAGMMAIFMYRKQLEGLGRRYSVTTFPFSATQRDKAVNDGLYIKTHNPYATKKQLANIYRQTQYSVRTWASKWGNPPDVASYLMFEKSATGGIIACNESYLNKPVENVGQMDLSSSYPSDAGDFLFPRFEFSRPYTGWMEEDVFRIYLKTVLIPMAEELRSGQMKIDHVCINHKYCIGMRTGFVCKIRFHNIIYHDFGKDSNGFRYWIPILTYKDFDEDANEDFWFTLRGKVLDHETMEYYCTHIGLLLILAFYDYDYIDFISGYTFEMAPIQRIIHNRFESGIIGKQEAKKICKAWERGELTDDEMIRETGLTYLTGKGKTEIEEDLKAYRNSAKVPCNSMYGANYRKLLRPQRSIDQQGNFKLDHPQINIDEDGNFKLISGNYDSKASVAYPTGLYIAIYGQFKLAHAMLWAMSKKLPILYAHTDSLKIQGLTKELIDEYNKLIEPPDDERDGEPISFRRYGVGLMDYEGSHDISVVIGNMRIISWDKDGKFSITMSGLNENVAFPEKKIKDLDFWSFCTKFLRDGKVYSVSEETSSGKTNMDHTTTAGTYIPGIGYAMQSIVDAKFVFNNPESKRQREIVSMYESLLKTEYHDCSWYAKQKYLVRYKNGKDKETGRPVEENHDDGR